MAAGKSIGDQIDKDDEIKYNASREALYRKGYSETPLIGRINLLQIAINV